MEFLLNADAVILCTHGGQVKPTPAQRTVLAGSAPVLCVPDLVEAPISGCPVPQTQTTKPCRLVVQVLPGSWSETVLVGDKPPYIASLNGITDGIPPGKLNLVFAGQNEVQG